MNSIESDETEGVLVVEEWAVVSEAIRDRYLWQKISSCRSHCIFRGVELFASPFHRRWGVSRKFDAVWQAENCSAVLSVCHLSTHG